MKKFFEEPELNIAEFDIESVVTGSSKDFWDLGTEEMDASELLDSNE